MRLSKPVRTSLSINHAVRVHEACTAVNDGNMILRDVDRADWTDGAGTTDVVSLSRQTRAILNQTCYFRINTLADHLPKARTRYHILSSNT